MLFGHDIFQNPLAYQTDTKWYFRHITFLQLVSPKKKKKKSYNFTENRKWDGCSLITIDRINQGYVSQV